MTCTHKTFADHTLPERDADGRLVWVCSHCGAVGRWDEQWSYLGNIECRECQTAAMEWVACSRACAKVLNGGKVPKPVEEDKPRAPRQPRKRRMTIRDKAAAYDQLVREGKV